MATQLSVAVVSPNKMAQEIISAALESRVQTVWCLDTYPDPSQLKQLPQPAGGCLLFLDFSDPARAKAIAAAADAFFPGISVVALYSDGKPQDLLELMRLGIREVIALPPTAQEVLQVLSRASGRTPSLEQAADSRGRILAFIPAKPGVGATTLAVHCTAAAARISNRRTLLVDFDFRLGMTSFLLKLTGQHSVIDALALSREMDESQWAGLINHVGMFDVLGSAPIEFHGADPEQGTGLLLEFARHLYDCVCVDLPGEMRDYELDTLSRAQECFLVCTPDIGAIHMAKRKVETLRTLNVDKRTSLIMNRSGGRGFMPVKDIEAILQLPVRFTVANAEREFTEATHAASVLQGTAPVVAQIENIARHIMPAPAETPQAHKPRKFIEFFSVAPVRERSRTL